MASSVKEIWTQVEWIEFGDRVKRVRGDLQSLIVDSQKVCRVRELEGLLKVVRDLDKWKATMENLAAPYVSEHIVNCIFYGKTLFEKDGE